MVAKEEFETRVAVAAVNEMRTLPSQHVFGSFGQHSLESHGGNEFADFIAVDEAGVAEDFGFFAKEAFHFCTETLHLIAEGFFVFQ